jgi:hypothetical protein
MNTITALIGIFSLAIGLSIGYKFGYRNGDHQGSRRGFARGIQVSRNIVAQVNHVA